MLAVAVVAVVISVNCYRSQKAAWAQQEKTERVAREALDMAKWWMAECKAAQRISAKCSHCRRLMIDRIGR